MNRPRLALAALVAACALVPATASASTGGPAQVSWEQVRIALAAAPHAAPGTPAPGAVTVGIPDLSAALDDPSAPAGVRRAACHQVTGLDDEDLAPLAACLAHVRAGA